MFPSLNYICIQELVLQEIGINSWILKFDEMDRIPSLTRILIKRLQLACFEFHQVWNGKMIQAKLTDSGIEPRRGLAPVIDEVDLAFGSVGLLPTIGERS